MSIVIATPVAPANPSVWGEVYILPENRSAVSAVRRVGKMVAGKTTPVPPLVMLHGPTGVGKTALVQQLVREVIAGPGVKTAQVLPAKELPTAETNADPFVDLLATDLLIIEDVQYLPAKNVIAFCRLLDQRFTRRLPSVLTSTTGAANLLEFPRRLTSRLASGLSVRMDPPDVESRRLLAEHFAGKRKVPLTGDAFDWLAERSTDGIRTLQGLIERLRPLSRRYALGITRSQAIAWLADAETEARLPSMMERIVTRVCAVYRVKPKDVIGTSRLRSMLIPRQVAMYLAKNVGKLPLTTIGSHFGGRDHTTVLHAVNKIAADIKLDLKLAQIVKELRAEF